MTAETNTPNLDVDLDVASPEFKIAHDRLVEVFAHRSARGTENPDEPDTVQAMQIALNLPKQHPPSRHDLLAAAAQAAAADIVLIAGKGHETYQDVQGEKHHFSDFEEAEKALDKAA